MADDLKSRSIWLVIPAYQAEATIGGVLRSVPEWIAGIIVVDDGSTDGTARAVESAGDPRVVLIRRATNGGVGAAVCDGYGAALEHGATIVVKMDADGQMDPAQLPCLVAPLLAEEADYAKGNRFRHWQELQTMPRTRLLGNSVLSFLVKLASGYWNVLDPTNGYTAIHRTALQQLPLDRLDRRYFFESDMLIHLGVIRAVVADVAIPARYAGENSSLSVVRAALWFPGKLLWRTFARIFWRHILTELTPTGLLLAVGLLLCLFGGAFGLVHWAHSIATSRVATTGTVMIAVLPIVVGVVFLTQAFVLDIEDVPREPLCRTRSASDAPSGKRR